MKFKVGDKVKFKENVSTISQRFYDGYKNVIFDVIEIQNDSLKFRLPFTYMNWLKNGEYSLESGYWDKGFKLPDNLFEMEL